MMTHQQFMTWLHVRHACIPAIEFVADNEFTPREAWQGCKNPDWMMWFAEKAGVGNCKQHVLCAAACARAVLHLVRDSDRAACEAVIGVAELYAHEQGETFREAASAALDKLLAGYAAANAAQCAGYAACRAHYAACSAIDASEYAVSAAASDPDLIAEMADAIRAIIPDEDVVL